MSYKSLNFTALPSEKHLKCNWATEIGYYHFSLVSSMGRRVSYPPFSLLCKEMQLESDSIFQAVQRILNHKLRLVPGETNSFSRTSIFINSSSPSLDINVQ